VSLQVGSKGLQQACERRKIRAGSCRYWLCAEGAIRVWWKPRHYYFNVGERPAPALRLDIAKVFFLFVKIGRDVVTHEREVEETKDFLRCNVTEKR
jgi:hypothetical protein